MSFSIPNSNNLPPISKGNLKAQEGVHAAQVPSLLASKNSVELVASASKMSQIASNALQTASNALQIAALPSLEKPKAPQGAVNISSAMRPLDNNHLSTYAILSILMELSSSVQQTAFLSNISQTFTSFIQEQQSVQEQLKAAKTTLAAGVIKGGASMIGGGVQTGGGAMKGPISETTGGDTRTYKTPEVEGLEEGVLGDDHIQNNDQTTKRTVKDKKITRTVGKDWASLGHGASTLIQGLGEIAGSITQSYSDKNQALAKQWDSIANALKSISKNWETTQQNLQKLFESLSSIYTQIEQAKNETLRSGSNMS